jgi:hypothetical protein
MAKKEWFLIDEPADDDRLAYQVLGHRNAACLRHWIRVGISEGWLRPGHHIKRKFPNRKKSSWLVHLGRCQAVNTSRI